MPIKRPQLINNEIYHIVVRGVSDQPIFKNNDDRYRVIFSLYEFNTVAPIEISVQRKKRSIKNKGEQFSDKRILLVEILAFCFMPNHIHLLLRQLRDNGITQFMRKFGAGYATYFNKKYTRNGHLFQGRFKAIRITTDRQLKTVFVYIHTNPVALIEADWKKGGIKNSNKAIEFLENYKWSSYQDYIGQDNFSSVTKRDFLLEVMGGKRGCQGFLNDRVEYKGENNYNYFSDIELE
ncbi:MAG: hypothetical protein US76_03005 [Parcubacteria group bacterium GW2011_GWA2_38_13b]|nr:MAG: hypothetical protein US76_03005 [Parcubacteria group bacterium GW2011_GWA2_38_13b]